MSPELIDLEKRINAAKARYGMTTRKQKLNSLVKAVEHFTLTTRKLGRAIDEFSFSLARFDLPTPDLKVTTTPSKD